MEGDGRHTRASYIEDDCKINAGIWEKEKILERIDEMEGNLRDPHKVECQQLFHCKLPMACHIDCKDYTPTLNVAEAMREHIEVPGGSTPSQYQLPDNATDLQDLIEYRQMNFSMGNIFKACYRSGNCSHSDLLRDINKILWFANRELQRLKLTKG